LPLWSRNATVTATLRNQKKQCKIKQSIFITWTVLWQIMIANKKMKIFNCMLLNYSFDAANYIFFGKIFNILTKNCSRWNYIFYLNLLNSYKSMLFKQCDSFENTRPSLNIHFHRNSHKSALLKKIMNYEFE
jgi:hypothetical protein